MTNYTVKQREPDKAWCIYLADYSVVVAEFAPGCQKDARNIAARLTAADMLVEAAQAVTDDPWWDADPFYPRPPYFCVFCLERAYDVEDIEHHETCSYITLRRTLKQYLKVVK